MGRGGNLLERFLKLDAYGSEIALFRLRGDDKVRSMPGACLSVLINLGLLFLMGHLMAVMFLYENSTIQFYSIVQSEE